MFRSCIYLSVFAISFTTCGLSFSADLNVLYLGDNGHHQPAARYKQLQPVLAKRGINLTYTDKMTDLSVTTLEKYDALAVYANIDRIDDSQAKALLNYVSKGGGFVPLHCATYCFRNNDEIVALMGAQFQRHGTGVFRAQVANSDHPITKGYGGFESWDETYVHHLHNEKNRTVLEYRVDAEGREPWTWVRTHGEGRVFYTAWGHDHRTWSNPGFHNLVERGIRWAAKDVDLGGVPSFEDGKGFPIPEMTAKRTDVAPFKYQDVGSKIPNYPPSNKWGVQEEPLSKMQLPLPPEESIKHFVTPKGFHLELFVSEPDLGGKPLCMTWDERGRLWVAETYDYPNELQPEGQGRDRIRICEDTDGDWKADKFTVFAEKLSIPTSITFHNGGAIVQDGTRTIFFKDNDGDDVADQREVMFEGWNQGDTHGGVSNFQYGHDNWIWAMQGYNNSNPHQPGTQSDLRFSNGFFRFKPDGSEIEFIRSTNNNTWGLGLSEEGIVFGSTANRNPSVYMPIPNRYYERVKGWKTSLRLGSMADHHRFSPVTDKVRQVDQHGGYTAGAGHALYTARNYPKEYWNRVAFVNGPTGHLVGCFVINKDGANFNSTSPFNLVASDDEWSAPIMSEVGPDGNVWVIDWYNYIIQHNPTPQGFKNGRGNAYETDLRDKKHGRIYRVVYGDEDAKPFSLAGASADKLVATLGHSNMFWRRQAQRLLVEKGDKSIAPKLFELVNNQDVDEIGLNPGAVHALWTLHGLGLLDGSDRRAPEIVVAALKHKSASVRRNALKVLPPLPQSTRVVVSAGALQDEDAQVRLAALLALADLPPIDEAGQAIAEVLNDEGVLGDRWLIDAVVSAAANNAEVFLLTVADSEPFSDTVRDRVKVVAEHFGRSGPAKSMGSFVASLSKATPGNAAVVIEGLSSGWPADAKPTMDDELEDRLEALVKQLPVENRGDLLKLASIWGSERLAKYAEEIISDLLGKVDDEAATNQERLEAAKQLVSFQSASGEIVGKILSRITPQTPPNFAIDMVTVLNGSEAPDLGPTITQNLNSLTPAVRPAAIRVLLNRRVATPSLLNGIDSGSIQLAELSLDQRADLARHPDREIRDRAKKLLDRGGALPNADRQKVLAEYMPITEEHGNAIAGKTAFNKLCAKCHRHSGEGKDIGPDLTGMAVHPKEELLTHILDPNRSVEGNFRVYNVVTNKGRVYNGMLASESRTSIELFDAEGKKTTLLRDDIEEFTGSQKSLMPEGIEKDLNRQELTDLLEFLTQRGSLKPIDFADVANVPSDRGMFNVGEGVFVFDDWSTKTFKGVPFEIADPDEGKVNNVVLLHGPLGSVSAKMPKAVSVPIGSKARTLHLLSGVSGWGYPYKRDKTVSMTVRIEYENGEVENHELLNGVHFADYIRRTDVPESEFAFSAGRQQVRYLAIYPKKPESVKQVEFVKGPDETAPVVLALTVEN